MGVCAGKQIRGLIWNDSPYQIQYLIYGAFEEIGRSITKDEIGPKIDLDIKGRVKVGGMGQNRELDTQTKYTASVVKVQPKKFAAQGLSCLERDKHKISIRIVTRDKQERYIIKDVVIKSQLDVCIKVRGDLSIKNMTEKQIRDKRQQLRKEKAIKQENGNKILQRPQI